MIEKTLWVDWEKCNVGRYKKMLQELGIPEERKAPILLPDYRVKAVLARNIDIW